MSSRPCFSLYISRVYAQMSSSLMNANSSVAPTFVFTCVVGKEFPGFPSHLKRRRSPQERREELRGRATIPRVPQMSQSIPGRPVFPALPRLSSRESTHTTVARGTALWESLVGKPRGKASRESNRSLDPREGKRDTAATAREKTNVHAPTRDED